VHRQVAPRHARAQNVEHRRDHETIILRRPSPARPPVSFGPRTVNFFSRCHTGSGSSHRPSIFMRAL
jgi:hypothetical protein